MEKFDAILLVSFGGPEGPDDVMPFLRNVTRGRNVPEERLLEVAHHYQMFGGVSPINQQNRDLIEALRAQLDEHLVDLPIYWGNRNWHPMLADTIAQMAENGVRRALAFATSAYSSYSGCRQYMEDIERARAAFGADAPVIEKIKPFWNRTGFIDANADRVKSAISQMNQSGIHDFNVVFTAHSIPQSMAAGCSYERQLTAVARAIADELQIVDWQLVYQSRSGPPSIQWLEPDICDHLRALQSKGVKNVVVAPIGFVSDHMEIIYDLDTEAMELAQTLGIKMVRAQTVGTHPAFVRMIRELVVEHLENKVPQCDLCDIDCCSYVRSLGSHQGDSRPVQRI